MELDADVIDQLGRAGVVTAWLFGSRADGRPRPDSDADVAVLLGAGRPRLGLLELESVANVLARAWGIDRVDVVALEHAPLELRARVVQQGQLLCSLDEVRRVAFEVDTQSRWSDVAPEFERATRRYLSGVAADGLGG